MEECSRYERSIGSLSRSLFLSLSLHLLSSAGTVYLFPHQVKGTVVVPDGATAHVIVNGPPEGDETRRVVLVNATDIKGAFSAIDVDGGGKRDGRCWGYFIGSTDRDKGSLSVLVVPKERKCKVSAMSLSLSLSN